MIRDEQLEVISDKIRMGTPVGFFEAIAAINYQEAHKIRSRKRVVASSNQAHQRRSPPGRGVVMARMEVGDTGMVNKDDAAMNWIRRAEVIKTPAGEGDVWGFKDLDSGREIFTNEHFTFYRDKSLAPGCGDGVAEQGKVDRLVKAMDGKSHMRIDFCD